MLSGLKEGQEKMSKSDPNSAIFMEDSEEDVRDKINLAYCPPGVVEKNPCLEYARYICFGALKEVSIKRDAKWGGDVTYKTYEELEKDYKEDKLHPGDLKPAIVRAINTILKPIRDHFKNDSQAKELLALVKSYRITKSADEVSKAIVN